MAIIDTSTLIDAMRGKKEAYAALKTLPPEELFVSTISIFELAAGSPAGIGEKRKRFLDAFTVVPFDRAHAELAGELHSRLRGNGNEIQEQDAMIAATAIVEHQEVVTANTKHFNRIQGLKVSTY